MFSCVFPLFGALLLFSVAKLVLNSFFFCPPECGRCSQSSDGQHAAQRRHARRTHASGLLSSKRHGGEKRDLYSSITQLPAPSSTHHTPAQAPPPLVAGAKPSLLSPPPFLASLAVLIPVQMCSLFCLSPSIPYVHTRLVLSSHSPSHSLTTATAVW